MCGIAGIRRHGAQPINENQIAFLLMSLEHRGNDAAGIAMQNRKGELFVEKDDVGAWKFCNSHKFKSFIEDHLNEDIVQVILHTRGASQGNPRFNKNNHPLYSGHSAIVHNGHIHNDDELFRDLKLKRGADTDSDIIRAIVDEEGISKGAITLLSRMRGSAAIACLSPDYPGKMLLARSGSPLQIASDKDFFFFASEKHAIHRAARPVVKRFGINFQFQSIDLAYAPMANDSAWILGDEGLEWHQEFRSLWGTYTEPVRRVHQGFKDRQSRWTRQAADEPAHVQCPKCFKDLVVTKENKHKSLWELHCPKESGGCGALLADRPVN